MFRDVARASRSGSVLLSVLLSSRRCGRRFADNPGGLRVLCPRATDNRQRTTDSRRQTLPGQRAAVHYSSGLRCGRPASPGIGTHIGHLSYSESDRTRSARSRRRRRRRRRRQARDGGGGDGGGGGGDWVGKGSDGRQTVAMCWRCSALLGADSHQRRRWLRSVVSWSGD